MNARRRFDGPGMMNLTRRFDVAPNRRLARDGARMRDAAPGQRNGVNRITPRAQLSQFGWIGPALSQMGNTSRWAVSMNPDNEIVAANGYPLETLATTPTALLNACYIACQGQAGKTYATIAQPGTPAAATLTLTANTANAFGARVRISNAITAYKYATYEIQFATGTTVLSYILVQVVSLPCDIIILGISNNAGKANVIGNTAPAVIFPFSATAGAIGNLNYGSMAAGDVLYAETLNMRDIGNIVDAEQNGAILI
jgi:hypothetical protein